MYFKSLLFSGKIIELINIKGFIILRKHIDEICLLIKIFMELDKNNEMICFKDFNIHDFRYRFMVGIAEGAVK